MPALSVSQVILHLNNLLGSDVILSDVCVIGEVSRVSTSASGHSYFSLKDEDGVLDSALFRGGVGGEHLELGAEVFAFGRVSVYAPSGRLQLIANLIEPSGDGLLQARFEEMKEKLESEGLFDEARKRAIPFFPNKLGIVTSRDAAAWQDIQQTINRRFPRVELILAHTPVQGNTAAPMIAEAINSLNQLGEIDSIIVARGGGSPEDLWPFNEEIVARAIFASNVPVISGVGHESDWSISDLVADLRASTPTAAAEQSVPDVEELNSRLNFYLHQLNLHCYSLIGNFKNELDHKVINLDRSLPDFVNQKIRLDDLIGRAGANIGHSNELTKEFLNGLTQKIAALSPNATIARGYSVIQKTLDGKIINSVGDVGSGENIAITVSDGIIDAKTIGSKNGSEIPEEQQLNLL